MLTTIHPKLPMRNKAVTLEYYLSKLGFEATGTVDYDGYLMVQKDGIEIHFFVFEELDPKENYGQVYIPGKKYQYSSSRAFTKETVGAERIFST